jgi:hypothetical protein
MRREAISYEMVAARMMNCSDVGKRYAQLCVIVIIVCYSLSCIWPKEV